ncbi:AhpC/TSA antioxidant enzyme-domain-containing protein [Amanita rubescens]|nr:AhpC/TSA antioxidant enzyme-domain-containing protein [Amanita rubescens]
MASAADIPDEQTLSRASDLTIYDSKGEGVKFGSLFEKDKTLVVFIRTFNSNNRNYVSQLAKVPQSVLDASNVNIVVIGCGQWEPISRYSEVTSFSGPIFADPSRELYHALGMTIETLARTPKGQQKRSYLPASFLGRAVESAWRALQRPTLIAKQGNISQLGGEFIFGPGKTCIFAYRMQHTEDHTEVAELMEVAGAQYPQSSL